MSSTPIEKYGEIKDLYWLTQGREADKSKAFEQLEALQSRLKEAEGAHAFKSMLAHELKEKIEQLQSDKAELENEVFPILINNGYVGLYERLKFGKKN